VREEIASAAKLPHVLENLLDFEFVGLLLGGGPPDQDPDFLIGYIAQKRKARGRPYE